MRLEELGDDEKKGASLRAIAKAAAELNTTSDPIEIILEGIRSVPQQMQRLVDTVVAMQEEYPMPQAGWDAFVRDIEYTNEKHGLNLVIRTGK